MITSQKIKKLFRVVILIKLSLLVLNLIPMAKGSYKRPDHHIYKIYMKAQKKKHLNGEFKKQKKNGEVKYLLNIKQGLLEGSSCVYWKKNIIRQKAFYKKGKLNGNLYNYNKDGSMESQVTYLNDKAHGVIKTFYRDGKLQEEHTVTNGVFNGQHKKYHPNGRIWVSNKFLNNQLSGLSQAFYPNGQLSGEGSFQNGVLHGLTKTYDEQGKLISRREYKFGNPIYSQQELELMKINALNQMAFQQSMNTMYQREQNDLLRRQNNILQYNTSQPRYYSGSITETGYGGYRVNMYGY